LETRCNCNELDDAKILIVFIKPQVIVIKTWLIPYIVITNSLVLIETLRPNYQENLANAKVSARQQCVYEGP